MGASSAGVREKMHAPAAPRASRCDSQQAPELAQLLSRVQRPCAAPQARGARGGVAWASAQRSQRGERLRSGVASVDRVAELQLAAELTLPRQSQLRQPNAFVVGTGIDQLGTAGVGHTQQALADVLSEKILSGDIVCCTRTVAETREEQAAKARRMFEATRISERGSRFPPSRFFEHEHEFSSAHGACQEHFLLPRMQAAACAALENWESKGGRGASGITHLVIGGLTAPRASPGPDAMLAHRLGLQNSVQRVPLHHLGCLGGYRALAIAADIARGDPEARVLVVYGDVSSLIGASLQSPMNEADLLSIAIFTDGAAACVVAGDDAVGQDGTAPLVTVASCRTDVIRNVDHTPTYDQMWLKESGFRPDGSIIGENFVGKSVPKHLLRGIGPFVSRLVNEYAEQSGTSIDVHDLPMLVHPGGPAILASIKKALSIEDWQLEHSWRVLAARGNMSGATNLHVLHSFLEGGCKLPSGERASHGVGLAFGPGLAVEGLVFEFNE